MFRERLRNVLTGEVTWTVHARDRDRENNREVTEFMVSVRSPPAESWQDSDGFKEAFRRAASARLDQEALQPVGKAGGGYYANDLHPSTDHYRWEGPEVISASYGEETDEDAAAQQEHVRDARRVVQEIKQVAVSLDHELLLADAESVDHALTDYEQRVEDGQVASSFDDELDALVAHRARVESPEQ